MSVEKYRLAVEDGLIRLTHESVRIGDGENRPVQQITYLIQAGRDWMDSLAHPLDAAHAILLHATASPILTQSYGSALAVEKMAEMEHGWELTRNDLEEWLAAKLRGSIPLKPHPNPKASGQG